MRRLPPNAGKGRPKGVPNRTTVAAKEAMDLAFQGTGGWEALRDWANKNKTEFYRLWAKRIPVAVEGPGETGEIIIRIVRDTATE